MAIRESKYELPEEPRRPWVIAHRGDSSAYPENTMAAFRAAIESPADAIELDLQLSRDGIPMVFHDQTLERIGHGRRRLRELDCAELQALDAGSWREARFASERIPTLRDVLSEIRAKAILLEWKVFDDDDESGVMDRLVDRTIDIILAEGAMDRLWMLSFSAEALRKSKQNCPALRTVLNVRSPPERPDDLSAWIRDVDAVDVNIHRFGQEDVEAIHHARKPLFAYTCNTREDVGAALAFGVRGIITDCPAAVRSMLDEDPSLGP